MHHLFVLAVAVVAARAIMFELQAGTERCLRFEAREQELLVGTWELIDRSGNAASPALPLFWITGPEGNELFRQENARIGRFSVEPGAYGDVEICARDVETHLTGGRVLMQRDLKVTLDNKANHPDFREAALKEQLQPIEMELRLIEDQAKHIHSDMEFQRKREEELRDLNESTNSRAAWLSIFSLIVLGASSVWQMVYLKMFFTKKKII